MIIHLKYRDGGRYADVTPYPACWEYNRSSRSNSLLTNDWDQVTCKKCNSELDKRHPDRAPTCPPGRIKVHKTRSYRRFTECGRLRVGRGQDVKFSTDDNRQVTCKKCLIHSRRPND